MLHSSISTVLGGLGLAAYSGANAVLDAIAIAGGERWLSIDWDLWDNAGEAQAAACRSRSTRRKARTRFCGCSAPTSGSRVLVVASDLAGRLKAWVRHDDSPSAKGCRGRAPPAAEPRDGVRRAAHGDRARAGRHLGRAAGVASIGIHDRFFDLGGHSLLAVQVASEIRDRFQIEMPVLKLFQAPTIAELAVLVEQARSSEPAEAASGCRTRSDRWPTLGGDAARGRRADGRGQGQAIATSTTT